MQISIKEEYEDSDSSYIAEISADIIYCAADFGTTAAVFVENHFLSVLLGVKITSLGRLEYLHYIGTDAATATAYYSDGSRKDFQLLPIGGNDKYTTIDTSPSQFCLDGKTLAAYTIQAGKRTQEYQLDFTVPDCAPVLIFDNSFGVIARAHSLYLHHISEILPLSVGCRRTTIPRRPELSRRTPAF